MRDMPENIREFGGVEKAPPIRVLSASYSRLINRPLRILTPDS